MNRRKYFFLAAFSTIVLQMTGIVYSADSIERSDLMRRASDAIRCFNSRIDDLRAAGRHDLSSDTALRSVFVFESIQRYLMDSNGNRGEFFLRDSVDFCSERLVTPYLAAANLVASDKAANAPDIFAPAGTMPIESTTKFIQFTQNLTGAHTKGHSDLTQEAISRIRKIYPISDTSAELIVRASQSPDLFRWKQERFHAHSLDYQASDFEERRRNIADGKRSFVNLLRSLQIRIRSDVSQNIFDRALFLIGVYSHAIQDLTYHRGITLRQHSGLSYALSPSRNPDLPTKELELSRWEEAVGYTTDFMRTLLDELDPESRSRLLTWKPPEQFGFQTLARRVFGGDEEDISALELISYWWLSRSYLEGSRPLSELEQNDACNNALGAACWLPSEVLREISKK